MRRRQPRRPSPTNWIQAGWRSKQRIPKACKEQSDSDERVVETFTINYAKTHLSRQIEKAAKAEAFIIAKAGKPLVKVVPIDAATEGKVSRIGILDGLIKVPDDFDTMFADEIEEMFYGDK
jgi:antitoxin (DNA-binding transcriptional repressor) of toxin-antitoxin stability system